MGIFLGLFTAFIQGFSSTLIKRSYSDVKPSVTFAVETVFGVLLWSSFAFLRGIDINDVINIFPIVIVSAVLSEAYIFYIYSKGEISITGTIFNTYSIYTIIFSYVLNGERLTLVQYLFIALTILGTIIIGLPSKFSKKEIKNLLVILWPLSGAVAVGFSDSVSKGSINSTNAATFLFTLGIAQIIIATIYLLLEKAKIYEPINVFKNYKSNKFVILGGLVAAIGMIFFWLTFENVEASIASPLTATSPVVIVILAKFFLKEKISVKAYLGIALTIIGVIGTSIII